MSAGIPQDQHEAEEAAREHQLLEAGLHEVRGREVWQAHQRGAEQTPARGQTVEPGEGGQAREHRDCEQQPEEHGTGVKAQALTDRRDQSVRADRISGDRDARGGTDRPQGVGLAHVKCQIGAEARPELADAPVGDEGERADQ